jgi:hypothetical protein
MKTLSYMWNAFNWPGKVGIIGGFIGGAVGIFVPIIAILATPGSTGSKIWGLVFVLIFGTVFIGIFVFAFGKVFGSQARQRELQKTGARAEATITGLKETGLTVNEIYPIVKILLEVRPPGGQPYQAEVQTMVSRLDIPQIQPGTVVAVAYDPADPSNVALTTAADAEAMAGAASFAPSAPGGLAPVAAGAGGAQTEQARAMEEFLKKNDEDNEKVLATGQPAPAIIVQTMPLNVFVNGSNPAMTFILEVKPEGQPSFQTQVTGVIGEASIPKYQAGKTVYVKYDPADHSRISLDHS